MIRYQFKVKLYDEREYIQDVYINFNLKKELQNFLSAIQVSKQILKMAF